MMVNEFDRQIADVTQCSQGSEQDILRYKGLLESLCEELKQLWQGKGFTVDIAKELIDDCLRYATAPIGECEWDDLAAEQLCALLSMADTSPELRRAVSWADRSRDTTVRLLHRKLEAEEDMFFVNEKLENLDGMAYRLLTWLNARNSLIQAHLNR
ncbi:hypothetical protein [Exiguobacterium sp. s168]|uniref:hypothetical protein n=1 Tax=Exiguobacterium sp. s168 TaxID=2751194 RepID=UPI001BE592C4|nr:hypothetical protein [Exiguobacterium sp. s168]